MNNTFDKKKEEHDLDVDILTCNGPITLLNVFLSKETHLRGDKEVTVA